MQVDIAAEKHIKLIVWDNKCLTFYGALITAQFLQWCECFLDHHIVVTPLYVRTSNYVWFCNWLFLESIFCCGLYFHPISYAHRFVSTSVPNLAQCMVIETLFFKKFLLSLSLYCILPAAYQCVICSLKNLLVLLWL